MQHVQPVNSSAGHGTPDMAILRQKKAGIRLHAVIFLALAGSIIVSGCLSILTFPGSTGQTHRAENEGKLFAYFLDVGQGDSTLFVYQGKTILIDAGEIDIRRPGSQRFKIP